MNSILEKAIVHLLNEENDKATALFHKFMVERARQIHESLRQGEDVILENWDDVVSEEYFTESDLDGIEGDVDGEMADTTGEDNAGFDAETADADADASADLADDMGVDADAPVEGDETLDDIKSGIEELLAKFDAMMGNDTSENEDMPVDGEDFAADEDAVEDDASAEDDFSGFGDETSEEDDEEVKESDEFDDEEFDDITESIMAELEKVSVTMSDDKEIGTGKSVGGNKTSSLPGKKAEPGDAKPVGIKSSNHTGFERETAPTVKDGKKRQNTRSASTDKTEKVSKEGDKGSMLNKDFAGSASNDKSPLAKKGSPF